MTVRRHQPGVLGSAKASVDTIRPQRADRALTEPLRSEPADVHHAGNTPSFHQCVLAHLDSGYNLALWMLRDEHLASDALQEAALKAWRVFGSFRGGDGKSWFLAVVRTCAIDAAVRAGRRRPGSLDDGQETDAESAADAQPLPAVLRRERAGMVSEAVWSLPAAVREVLVLREIEGLSYAQIAETLGVPIGTVMSRVSRARDAAAAALRARLREGAKEQIDGV
jgi:RNA polymerase sigma-70 factor (ECF subfamily)